MALGVSDVIFLLVFGIHFFALPCIFLAFPPVAGGMAMAFADDLSLPLEARSSFHSVSSTLPASLPCCSEVWEWVLRSCIFDACSSSWNRGFHELSIIMHIRLIRVG